MKKAVAVTRTRHESEAHRAVARATSGAKVAPHELSAAAPARRLGGAGRPLPGDVRERLEQVFAADLAAVRVHEGPTAVAATRGTRGVASGAHVYLGRGESADASATFPVLVHEIAHVVQQSGEPDPAGRVVVRDVAGTAEPFRWDAPFTDTVITSAHDAYLADWAATARARGDSDAGASIDALVVGLRAAMAASTTAAFWDTRAKHVIADTADPVFATGMTLALKLGELKPLARAALFDGLKLAGKIAAPAKILRVHDDTESGVWRTTVYDSYVTTVGVDVLLDRIVWNWQNLKLLGEARPGKLLGYTATYLIGLFALAMETPISDTSAPTRKELLKDLEAVVQAEIKAGAFYPNELQWAALLAIRGLEEHRIAWLTDPGDGSQLVITGDDAIDSRLTIAQDLVDRASYIAKHADGIKAGTDAAYGGTAETRHLLVRDFAPAMHGLAKYIIDLYRLGALALAASKKEGLDLAKARGLDADTLKKYGTTKPEPYPGVKAGLLALAKAFFKRNDDGSLPKPDVYEARVAALTKALTPMTRDIQAKIIERIHRAWNVAGKPLAFDANLVPADRNAQFAQGTWLIATLGGYKRTMGEYVKQADLDFAATWSGPIGKLVPPITAWPGDDVRVQHRGLSAQALHDVALAGGMTELADFLLPITSARETWAKGAQQDDVLAIAQEWQPQSYLPISQLSIDMEGGTIQGWEQFTTAQVVTFFQGDHYRRVAARIDTLLGGPAGKKFDQDVPILNEARTTETASPERPLRHSIPPHGFIYLYRGKDAAATGVAPRSSLYQLIKRHPITQATVAGWPNHLVPSNQPEPDLVLWRIPTPSGLARFLQAIPAVNTLLARYALIDPLAGQKVIPDAAGFQKMTDLDLWWKWWEHLTMSGANALQFKRLASLKAIPEVNAKLAEYAKVDVVAPTKPPAAADLGAMDDDTWVGWLERLTDDVEPALWKTRNLGFRKIPAVDTLLETYAKADAAGGGTAHTAAEITAMGDDKWLELWKRVLPVATRRREELSSAIQGGKLFDALRADSAKQWSHLVDRERAALVHERQRVITIAVLPYLDKYDPTANAWEEVEVNKRKVFARQAAETALENLMRYFVWPITDEDFISDANPAPQERASHQAAAMLSIALRVRDKVVEPDGKTWKMRGWDRDVAWAWILPLQETLDFLDKSPNLDRFLTDSEKSTKSWVADRKTALENTYDGLFATMAEHRKDFGIVAEKGDGTIENPGGIHAIGGGSFGPGKAFTIDGITWEILGVEETFVYHPSLRNRHGVDVLPSYCQLGSGEILDMQAGDGKRTLLRVDQDGHAYEAKNDRHGDELLRKLSYAAMMAGTVEQLMALAHGIEDTFVFVGGLILDIAELFPVAGQAAAAARVTAVVASVAMDTELHELIRSFFEDPAGVIDKVLGDFTSNLSVEKLAETLLLSPSLEWLETVGKRHAPKKRQVGRTSSVVGRVLRRLASIGRAILGAIGRAVGFGHDVRDDIQAFVLEHTLLARVLNFVVEHLHFVTAIPDLVKGWDKLPGDVITNVRNLFVGLMDSVGKLRLPDRVVTLDDAVEFILDIIGKRLGGKYALGYHVIKALLQATDNWTWVVSKLSGLIESVIGDPTKYVDRLMQFVNKELTPHVVNVQVFLHEILAGIYDALPWHTDKLPKPGPINIESTGQDFLDAAALPREGAGHAVFPVRVELGGGSPLAAKDRARFQGQLGQGLGHVRVHTGGDAERATRAAGARALTTGSHVLLASDVAIGTDGGDRVLRHELVHVIQQTGPQTDGSTPPPSVGEPGRGLRVDPHTESIAEKIAAEGMPRVIPPSAIRGFQPSAIGFGTRFVDYLLHVEKAKEEIDRLTKTGTGTGSALIGAQVKEDVTHVGTAIKAWIKAFGSANIKTSVQSTFKPAVKELQAWLTHHETDIANAVLDLAIDASEPVGKRKDARGSQIMKLDVEAFEKKLQRFVVIATGCSIDFELHILTDGTLNKVAPLQKAVFNNLNLAIVPYDGPGQVLWDLMLTKTFKGAAQTDVHVRTQARILLFAYGFGSNPWEPAGGFRLNDQLAKQIEREGADASTITLLEADKFWHGPKRHATETDSALWIGKHGDPTHHGMKDRQSHHTTQYLLVQFYGHRHRLKPFPEMAAPIDALFTGKLKFVLDKDKVLQVDDIAVGSLDPGTGSRGIGMPAILVSAVMHRRGRLHVQPLAETEDDDVPLTQGGALMSWWKTALVAELGDVVAAQYWDAVDTLKAGKPATGTATAPPYDPKAQPAAWLGDKAPVLVKAIPAAMRRTYREMRSVMLPAIEPALRTLEVTWYEQLAQARKKTIDSSSPYHVTSTMIKRVADEALANNKRIMEDQSKWG